MGEWAVQYGCHQPYTTESGYEVAVEVKANKTIVKSVSKFGDIVLTEIAWDLGVGEAVVRVKEEGRARFRILGFATCQMPTSR